MDHSQPEPRTRAETEGVTKVALIGASGYTGAELLRLCAAHPGFEVAVATADTQAGVRVAQLYPHLAAAYPDLVFTTFDASALDGVEVAFLGLPHGASQAIVAELLDRVPHLVDLAADFRLADPTVYPEWYGAAHRYPELLGRAVYGLPELDRTGLAGAALVAVAGCYPTAATLALAPLLEAGVVEATGIVVDAASGVSGAGRPPKPNTTFCAVDEDFSAYGLLRHRHTPEMEQNLTRASAQRGGAAVQVLFTPHLAPMSRGILATCYARARTDADTAVLLDLFRTRYAAEPFVVVGDDPPSTKATLGSNVAHLTVRADARTGAVVAIAAIDNLVKGASGQAIQCANAALGLPEPTGLPIVGVSP